MWTMLPLRFSRDRLAAEHLRAEPGAAQVDVDQARPLLVGELEERHDRLDARVVDEDVEAAELFPRLVDHRLDVGALRDVAFDGDRLAALGLNPFDDVFGRLRAFDVVHGDVRAFFGEDFGDAAADAAARTSDERFLTFESHSCPWQRPAGRLARKSTRERDSSR